MCERRRRALYHQEPSTFLSLKVIITPSSSSSLLSPMYIPDGNLLQLLVEVRMCEFIPVTLGTEQREIVVWVQAQLLNHLCVCVCVCVCVCGGRVCVRGERCVL